MKIVVTGGTGFIGSHVLPLLANEGNTIIALHRRESDPPKMNGVAWHKSSYETANWADIKQLLGGKPDVILNLAAYGVSPTQEWSEYFKWNVSYTLDFWLAAIENGVTRIISCGSCFEYGAASNQYDFIPTTAAPQPLGPYAASKAAATMLLSALSASYNIEALVLRPCIVFGEGEKASRLWPSLRKAALQGEDFQMTSGLQVRDFIPVEKVAEALVYGVRRTDLTKGRLVIENLGSGVPMSVRDFALEWWHKWDGKGELLFGHVAGRAGEASRIVPEIS
jgi:nucleoside-diphosphate-sugar epimerase